MIGRKRLWVGEWQVVSKEKWGHWSEKLNIEDVVGGWGEKEVEDNFDLVGEWWRQRKW